MVLDVGLDENVAKLDRTVQTRHYSSGLGVASFRMPKKHNSESFESLFMLGITSIMQSD